MKNLEDYVKIGVCVCFVIPIAVVVISVGGFFALVGFVVSVPFSIYKFLDKQQKEKEERKREIQREIQGEIQEKGESWEERVDRELIRYIEEQQMEKER